MPALTKEQILNYKANTIKPVEAFGGTVYVTVMTIKQREQWEQVATTPATKHKSRATFLASVLCDEQGNKLFSTEDIESLNSLQYSDEIDKLFLEATQLNKATAEDIEAATKNS